VRKRTIGSQSDEVKESLRKLHISVVWTSRQMRLAW
jgi:hypothetical protein